MSELDDELAGVLAVEEHVDGDGQLLESLHDGLRRSQLALCHPLGQLRDDLRCAIEVVEDDEALEVDALDEEVAEVARAGRDGPARRRCRWRSVRRGPRAPGRAQCAQELARRHTRDLRDRPPGGALAKQEAAIHTGHGAGLTRSGTTGLGTDTERQAAVRGCASPTLHGCRNARGRKVPVRSCDCRSAMRPTLLRWLRLPVNAPRCCGPCSSALRPPDRADRGHRAQVLDQHRVDGESALA